MEMVYRGKDIFLARIDGDFAEFADFRNALLVQEFKEGNGGYRFESTAGHYQGCFGLGGDESFRSEVTIAEHPSHRKTAFR